MDYKLIDSGNELKLERFGEYTLIRPAPSAIWQPQMPLKVWQKADATFTREGGHQWKVNRPLPKEWNVDIEGIQFKLKCTDFGHLGVFPEHAALWKMIREEVKRKKEPKVLNLFAYSGGATLAAAQGGADVCHLDAAKGMNAWARENAALNKLEKAPIRWIVDDVMKFLAREIRRNERYDGIILDPPSFGRGKAGEVFKIENELSSILKMCLELLTEEPLFLALSCHTAGYTPLVLKQLLSQTNMGGTVEAGEMVLQGEKHAFVVPVGSYSMWRSN
jgi:23S rRNA (cytosine1962-C5)-methyltransferase